MTARIPNPVLIAAALFLSLILLPGLAFSQNTDSILVEDGKTAYAQAQQQEPPAQAPEQEPPAQTSEPTADDQQAQQQVTVQEPVERESVDWMWIIARGAILGGVVGGLVGLGGYLVSGRTWDPWTIAQFAGGGILVGTAVGVAEVFVRQGDRAASLEWMERDAPRTFQVPIFGLDF